MGNIQGSSTMARLPLTLSTNNMRLRLILILLALVSVHPEEDLWNENFAEKPAISSTSLVDKSGCDPSKGPCNQFCDDPSGPCAYPEDARTILMCKANCGKNFAEKPAISSTSLVSVSFKPFSGSDGKTDWGSVTDGFNGAAELGKSSVGKDIAGIFGSIGSIVSVAVPPPYGPVIGGVVSVFSSIFGAIFGGSAPSNQDILDAVEKGFKEVNQRLDQISQKLDQINQ